MALGELDGWSPDTIKMIDRFEEWCDVEKLSAIKNETNPEEIRKNLLNNELEQWFHGRTSDKPWAGIYPTQRQSNAFTGSYELPTHNVNESQKRYDSKYEFESYEYFYRRDKKAYADIKGDKIYEDVREDEVTFTYGTRIVLRDKKGRFIKHLKNLETGKWLI